MVAREEERDRRIIPRWRLFGLTLATGELAGSRTRGEVQPSTTAAALLEARLDEWRANQGLSFASDAIGVALVSGSHEKGRAPAEFIAALGDRSTGAARAIADALLGMKPASHGRVDAGAEKDVLWARVRMLRDRLGKEPRNAIAWTDLAHEYTLLGHLDHAKRAMRVALATGTENRFVLRSAARFLLHTKEVEEAYRVLRNAPISGHDPWLMAAEIAVASRLERTPRFAKKGMSLLAEQNMSPSQTTELSSALGTLELESGSPKRAKKLFKDALESPTENSVAQAEWASRQNIGLRLTEGALATPGSFEARSKEFRASGAWEDCLVQARSWLSDQPFSREASGFASYVASVGLERYEECAEIARQGLVAAPKDPLLLNNLAFALASDGRITEAVEAFRKIPRDSLSSSMRAVFMATQGLLNFRLGHPDLGRAQYLQAIEAARLKGEKFQAALAALYLARETRLARVKEAAETRAMALEVSDGSKEPEIQLLRTREDEAVKAEHEL